MKEKGGGKNSGKTRWKPVREEESNGKCVTAHIQLLSDDTHTLINSI